MLAAGLLLLIGGAVVTTLLALGHSGSTAGATPVFPTPPMVTPPPPTNPTGPTLACATDITNENTCSVLGFTPGDESGCDVSTFALNRQCQAPCAQIMSVLTRRASTSADAVPVPITLPLTANKASRCNYSTQLTRAACEAATDDNAALKNFLLFAAWCLNEKMQC